MTEQTTTPQTTAALRNELRQLEDIVADCKDLEEPVPGRVRRDLARVRRLLREREAAA